MFNLIGVDFLILERIKELNDIGGRSDVDQKELGLHNIGILLF